MKFKYKKYAPNVIRPVIPIEVNYGKQSIPYEVLVDSGADLNIFDEQIGELLGIDIKAGAAQHVSGITKGSEVYYLHNVHMAVGGHQFKTKVGFKKFNRLGYGVVGQKGFFEFFKVTFDYLKETLELKLK